MLPVALRKWEHLEWEPVDIPDWPPTICLICAGDPTEEKEHRPTCEPKKEALYSMARETIQGLGLDPRVNALKWLAEQHL